MNIQEIFNKEPAVKGIVNSIASDKTYNDVWEAYSACKKQTEPFVGWYARRRELKNCAAYDALNEYICDRLGV